MVESFVCFFCYPYVPNITQEGRARWCTGASGERGTGWQHPTPDDVKYNRAERMFDTKTRRLKDSMVKQCDKMKEAIRVLYKFS